MLTETEMAAWYERLNFSESTQAVIEQCGVQIPPAASEVGVPT